MIFHITSRAALSAARECGYYEAPSLHTEGFIHCSTRDQLIAVANVFYQHATELSILGIDPAKLADLHWEAPAHPDPKKVADGITGQFPHIYGTIPLKAIKAVYSLTRGKEELFSLSPELSSLTDTSTPPEPAQAKPARQPRTRAKSTPKADSAKADSAKSTTKANSTKSTTKADGTKSENARKMTSADTSATRSRRRKSTPQSEDPKSEEGSD